MVLGWPLLASCLQQSWLPPPHSCACLPQLPVFSVPSLLLPASFSSKRLASNVHIPRDISDASPRWEV